MRPTCNLVILFFFFPSRVFCPEQVPIVSRREQLGTDDAALEKAAVGEEKDEAEDYVPDTPGPADRLEGSLPPKAKPARSKPKAKSTPKARAKAKAKAKAKASATEKKRKADEKLEMNKERAKRQCKTKPAAPAESAESETSAPPQLENGGLDNMDVESKAPEREENEPAEVEKQHSKKASRARKASEAEASNGEPKQPKDPNTFASRYMPEDEGKAARFRAIRDVFVQQVAGRLKSQSRFQDRGPIQGSILIQVRLSMSTNALFR